MAFAGPPQGDAQAVHSPVGMTPRPCRRTTSSSRRRGNARIELVFDTLGVGVTRRMAQPDLRGPETGRPRAVRPGEGAEAGHVRPAATAGPRRGAVGARRHAAEQGRHRRRRRGAAARRLLPARPPDRLRLRSSTSTAAASPPTRSPCRPSCSAAASSSGSAARPYLHTLIATVPTAANAGYYAEIVAEKAILRRLVEAGTRIVQLGYARRPGRRGQRRRRPRAGRHLRGHRALAPARTTSPSRSCCSPRWTRSTPSPPAAASRCGVPTGFADLDAAHQRPAPRPDDRRRGPARAGQVDARAGLRPLVLGQARHDQRSVLAGDEQDRDRHAAAVGRGAHAARRHARGPHDRRRLDHAWPGG